MRTTVKSAFSLFEILVAVAILATLAAIIAPVIVRSKNAARQANDISNLRQLGLAAAMYMDAYGHAPAGCPTLVEVATVPPSLCAGMLDPYPEGLANRLTNRLGGGLQDLTVEFRVSFVGRREYGWPQKAFDEAMQSAEAVGWLVDLAPSESLPETEPADCLWLGRYRRLLLVGSVQWRSHKRVLKSPGGPERWMPIMLFGDFDDEWIRKQGN